jgi:hypothetical protein
VCDELVESELYDNPYLLRQEIVAGFIGVLAAPSLHGRRSNALKAFLIMRSALGFASVSLIIVPSAPSTVEIALARRRIL